ncbi:sec-independent protein translocase TatC [Pedobacter sp. HMF7647]|uniref:Sec-independent protein translocase TatC n=1 Tax=Hufsiella arboris TaxID=2695275 RepID=A0A7K1YDW3_9SPHI|nr:group III truncated hemoglobin [Hufsiella arboris]MXV52794.1 sec-independent protein translocase TatC [Hufsiella arboris]
MKHDLKTIEDIKILIDSFYTKVQADETLGPVFNKAENFNWDTHIPIMYNFWETLLFAKTGYKGNPVRTHIELNRRVPLTDSHFSRWKELFFMTLDELFSGPKVNEAKAKVESMEVLMKIKIKASENPGFIL